MSVDYKVRQIYNVVIKEISTSPCRADIPI